VPDTAPMSHASIPIWAQCHGGVGFPEKGPANGSPCVNLQVNISIPIKDLLQALTITSGSGSKAPAQAAPTKHKMEARTVAPVGMLATVPAKPKMTPVTGDWEDVPSRSSSGRSGHSSEGSYLVRVSNIPRALAASHIKSSFEQHVGPVLECAVDQGVASLYFASEALATKAVADYDGGIIELAVTECTDMRGDFGANEEQIEVSLKDNSCCQSYLEDHMGPLSRCSMRRGRGWITIFRSEIGPQLKRDKIDGRNSTQKGFKACFISVYHGYWQRVIDDFMQGGSLDL